MFFIVFVMGIIFILVAAAKEISYDVDLSHLISIQQYQHEALLFRIKTPPNIILCENKITSLWLSSCLISREVDSNHLLASVVDEESNMILVEFPVRNTSRIRHINTVNSSNQRKIGPSESIKEIANISLRNIASRKTFFRGAVVATAIGLARYKTLQTKELILNMLFRLLTNPGAINETIVGTDENFDDDHFSNRGNLFNVIFTKGRIFKSLSRIAPSIPRAFNQFYLSSIATLPPRFTRNSEHEPEISSKCANLLQIAISKPETYISRHNHTMKEDYLDTRQLLQEKILEEYQLFADESAIQSDNRARGLSNHYNRYQLAPWSWISMTVRNISKLLCQGMLIESIGVSLDLVASESASAVGRASIAAATDINGPHRFLHAVPRSMEQGFC